MTIETKTAQAVRLRADGLSYAEIASRIGATTGGVGALLARARNPSAQREYKRKFRQRDPEKWREYYREYRRKREAEMTPEEKAERNYRRKCRAAGVKLDA